MPVTSASPVGLSRLDIPHGEVGEWLYAEYLLLSESEKDALCEPDTLSEALVATLVRLTGRSVYTDQRRGEWLVSFVVENTQFAFLTFRIPKADYWAGSVLAMLHPPEGRSAELHDRRRRTLPGRLEAFQTVKCSPADTLIHLPVHSGGSDWWAMAAATLPAWWDQHVAEGCDDDTARMLLGLTVSPELAAHIRYDDVTGRPYLFDVDPPDRDG